MRTPKTLIALILLVSAASVSANGNYNYQNYVYAPVVDVEPVYDRTNSRYNRNSRHDRQCYRDRRYDRRSSNRSSGGGAVLGGIIGGIIGNRFGKGNGRRAATAAGTIIGATIGAENSKYKNRNSRSYRNSRHCRDYNRSDRVIGFNVSYDYNGRIYQSFMRNHPGERVRLDVDVRIAE